MVEEAQQSRARFLATMATGCQAPGCPLDRLLMTGSDVHFLPVLRHPSDVLGIWDLAIWSFSRACNGL